jgi:hypothetical protein
MERDISKVTGRVVGKATAHHHKLGFTQTTLSLVVDKHRAHCVLLGRPPFVELHLAYREANAKVKSAIATDANAFARKQVKVVECL